MSECWSMVFPIKLLFPFSIILLALVAVSIIVYYDSTVLTTTQIQAQANLTVIEAAAAGKTSSQDV